MSRVIHTGQALVDVVVEVPDLPARGQNVMAASATDYAGGAVTVLVAAARFGAECVHAGAHGTGPHGDLVRAALGGRGDRRLRSPGARPRHRDLRGDGGAQRASAPSSRPSAPSGEISVGSLATSDPRPGDLVCVTGFSLALASTRDPLLAWLPTLDPDVVVVLDPGAAFAGLSEHVRAAMLEVTDVWSSNAEEAEDLLREVGEEPPRTWRTLTTAVAPLLRGDAVAIVRDGPEGCAVQVAGETTYVTGFPQKPLDTNGAGDTHTGALLAEVAAGTPWVEGCRRANAAAAIKVTRRGPESAPTAAEVDEFLAGR